MSKSKCKTCQKDREECGADRTYDKDEPDKVIECNGYVERERKPRTKPNARPKMMLVLVTENTAGMTLSVVQAGNTLKQLRQLAAEQPDGEYVSVTIRERITVKSENKKTVSVER